MAFGKKNTGKDGTVDKKHTIIVVDDDKEQLKSTASLLSDKYKVITAPNGGEALELIERMEQPEKEMISMVISDQRMLGLTGIELLKKTKDIIPKTIRFLYTAFDDIPVIIEAINVANVHQFILKDSAPEDILQRVEFALKYFDQQRELDEYHQHLKELVEERTEELKRAITVKDLFLSVITHDLGNQIIRLTGVAEMLNKIGHNAEGKVKNYIEKLYKGQTQTFRLSEDLRVWTSRQEGEIIKCYFVMTDIHVLVNKNIELFKEKAEDKKIELLSEVQPGTFAFADENMILTVIRNLIGNALAFTEKEGWVKISAVSGNDVVEVSVCDNGTGMCPEDVDKFNRDDLLESKKGTAGETGTGKGLRICKAFVEKNHGKISVTSESGKGTCFKFTLPVKEQEAKQL